MTKFKDNLMAYIEFYECTIENSKRRGQESCSTEKDIAKREKYINWIFIQLLSVHIFLK